MNFLSLFTNIPGIKIWVKIIDNKNKDLKPVENTKKVIIA